MKQKKSVEKRAKVQKSNIPEHKTKDVLDIILKIIQIIATIFQILHLFLQ